MRIEAIHPAGAQNSACRAIDPRPDLHGDCDGIPRVQQYENLIIENEDRQLLGLARSVDRSITSYLQQFLRDLEHTVRRAGLEEAEAAYRDGGSAAGIGQNLRDTILWDHPLTCLLYTSDAADEL